MHQRSQRRLLAVCAGLGLLVASCSSTSTGSTGAGAVAFGVVPGVDLGRQRHGADQGAARRHRLAVADGDRDAVCHRRREPGEGGRQVLGLPQEGAAHDPRRPVAERRGHRVVPARPRRGPRRQQRAHRLGSRPSAFPCCRFRRPPTLADAYAQYDQLGQATGHVQAAQAEAAHVKAQIAQIVREAPKSNVGQTYYYELDQTYYSVTSSTFIGKVLGLLGLRNIADRGPVGGVERRISPACRPSSSCSRTPTGCSWPTPSAVGRRAHTVAARPGWSTVKAVQKGQVVGLNDDIASRWGPRIVDLLQTVEAALKKHPGAT